MGVNLCLGVLYAWGAFQTVLVREPFRWTATQTQMPYMVACAVFAITMIFGGILQDRFGPKPVIRIAAAATLVGFVMSGIFVHSVVALTVFFGIFFGLASGFGYSATTPPAVKWFSPDKRGVISGIVVGGYGLAAVYVAPLTMYLLENYGISKTFILLGVAYGIAIFLLAQIVNNPPQNKVSINSENITKLQNDSAEYAPSRIIKTKQFYILWAMFCLGSLSSLMIVGQLRSIGLEQAQLTDELAFLLIAVYSIFNSAGRIGLGIVMDAIGGKTTLILIFTLRVIVFAIFQNLASLPLIFVGTAVVAFTYGGLASVFPAMTANFYGAKNMGANYALVFTAWGAGGIIGPLMGGIIRDATGAYGLAYVLSSILSAISLVLALTLKHPAHRNLS
jgi:OFA family oxalate/formate antiporter-like MFS transporter